MGFAYRHSNLRPGEIVAQVSFVLDSFMMSLHNAGWGHGCGQGWGQGWGQGCGHESWVPQCSSRGR